MASRTPSTRRPRCGLLTTAAVAAVAVLASAPAATVAAPPPRSVGSLPTTSRLLPWSCPASQSWHAGVGGDTYDTYAPPTIVRLPAAAVTDSDWKGVGRDSWWRIGAKEVGYDVLQYTPLNYAKTTNSPGAAITYRFTAPASGRYRWTMKAAAPHPTDWNDVFVRWVGTAGSTWGRQKAGGSWSSLPSGEWQKIYTNVGKDEWAWGGFNKDHDAHMLITSELTAGTVYAFQMTGRSHQIRVAAFALMRCEVDEYGSRGCANVKDLDSAPAAVCK
ncbi:hypothetical protein MMPV_006435 [Pyropia vietnamensis]